MANNFLTNLRASKSTAQNADTSSKLLTRGGIQQQRQNNGVADTFIKFLRLVSNATAAEKGNGQADVESGSPRNIDKMSPDMVEKIAEENYRKDLAADNAYGIFDNYDALNKVLDQYDSIETWAEKRNFLKDAYKNFNDKYGDIGRWFDKLYGFTIEAQAFNEPYTKNVSNVMRKINESVRRKLVRKS